MTVGAVAVPRWGQPRYKPAGARAPAVKTCAMAVGWLLGGERDRMFLPENNV